MDENDFVKAGLEVALRPVTDIAEDVLGRIGGDWLRENRARNRARLQAETARILKDTNTKDLREPSPSITIPLLSEAQDESRDELVSLWAKMLAIAMDSSRVGSYRREFVDIVKRLEPIDTRVLLALAADKSEYRLTPDEMANELTMAKDQVLLSYRNLAVIGITEESSDQNYTPYLSALGREFKRQVMS